MNKTEQKKHLTKSVIAFMNAKEYEVANDESGRIIFWNGKKGNESKEIQYSRNGDVTITKWATDNEKEDASKLESFVKIIKQRLGMSN